MATNTETPPPTNNTKEEAPSTTTPPTTSSTEPTIDNKVNAKPISGPAAGAKKKGGDKGGNKGKGADKGGDKSGDKEDDGAQRRRPGMIITEPVKGTRDFTPDDMRVRNWLFGHWKYVPFTSSPFSTLSHTITPLSSVLLPSFSIFL